MDSLLKTQQAIYRENYLKYGDTPQGTFQNNERTIFTRFEQLLKDLLPYKPHDFSVFDVGAGTALLHTYLLQKNITHQYAGSEIVEEMISDCLKKYPGINLYNEDITKNFHSTNYDFVVLSGTFNMMQNLSEKEWKDYCYAVILKMFDLCEIGISFNMLTSYSTFTDGSLAYFNPSEVFDFCQKNLSRFTILNHGYPLYEFTITVLKKDALKEKYTEEEFKKYFTA